MTVRPVVEGHGDVAAVPELLRRLGAALMAGSSSAEWPVVSAPIRQPRNKLVRPDGLGRAVELALLYRPDAVLVVFDSDDDCPAELGPELEQVARRAARGVPCAIVVAHREYEAWLLAAVESLRGRARIRADAPAHPEPEAPRDAKGQIEDRMSEGSSYHETLDQVRMTSLFDMGATYRRCRSFRHLVAVFGKLLVDCGLLSEVAVHRDWAL
jgi:hypothetical protein